MKYITKLKLAAIHQLCDAQELSTEFMYKIMMDFCKVDIDCVNTYMMLTNHVELFEEVNGFVSLLIRLDSIKQK
jgi:hypothetical protein